MNPIESLRTGTQNNFNNDGMRKSSNRQKEIAGLAVNNLKKEGNETPAEINSDLIKKNINNALPETSGFLQVDNLYKNTRRRSEGDSTGKSALKFQPATALLTESRVVPNTRIPQVQYKTLNEVINVKKKLKIKTDVDLRVEEEQNKAKNLATEVLSESNDMKGTDALSDGRDLRTEEENRNLNIADEIQSDLIQNDSNTVQIVIEKTPSEMPSKQMASLYLGSRRVNTNDANNKSALKSKQNNLQLNKSAMQFKSPLTRLESTPKKYKPISAVLEVKEALNIKTEVDFKVEAEQKMTKKLQRTEFETIDQKATDALSEGMDIKIEKNKLKRFEQKVVEMTDLEKAILNYEMTIASTENKNTEKDINDKGH